MGKLAIGVSVEKKLDREIRYWVNKLDMSRSRFIRDAIIHYIDYNAKDMVGIEKIQNKDQIEHDILVQVKRNLDYATDRKMKFKQDIAFKALRKEAIEVQKLIEFRKKKIRKQRSLNKNVR